MSKLIAIWGPPGTGKTTLAVKLGMALSEKNGLSVYTVFADNVTPALPVIFPGKKSEDMYSIGAILSRTETTQKDIEANTVTAMNLDNVGYLGYKDGENIYTYPRALEFKYKELFSVLKNMADVILVDCICVPDLLSKTAIASADLVIRVVAPDLKSISFCSSQMPMMEELLYHCFDQMVVLNVPFGDVYQPIADAENCFGKDVITLPYSQKIRNQGACGELTEPTSDKKYLKQLNVILSRI